jgi:uncharacterized protein YcnI
MKRIFLGAAALSALLSASLPALAHITLETKEAAIGGSYKAVLRVPHGCKGSATVKVRVRIPEGVINAKPQPKPGWTLELVKGAYKKTYATFHGGTVANGVQEIAWTGNLPDEYYDEFVFKAYLTPDLKAGGTLYFPVVQECEKGVDRWIEIPVKGKTSPFPAPGLKLLPKEIK